ncbi:type I restriction-modification system subunit M [uncultured Fusobacterium sp.]|uniref:type I restriction-modification system subunit M n=1 Tax=uncultured Fusobacterium sp. TaxID=159267 RepID=UPI0025D2E4C4|nr:type I restriction-modification system subunit M [uncultured Fusobacterium sp.]
MSEHQAELEKRLWAIANELRGNMGADEFRNYILGLIFFKFLSEKIEKTGNDILSEDEMKFEDIEGKDEYIEAVREYCINSIGYFIEPKYLFGTLARRARNGEFIIEDLGLALKYIEDSTNGQTSNDDFSGLFGDVDLTSLKLGKTVEDKNKMISEVIKHLNEINFNFDDTEMDVLGNAYEYLIGQFASNAGKKAGEFYTPAQASKLLAMLTTSGKERVKSAYDPTCGSGSLLLKIAKYTDVASFYGQELNTTTYNLARMNMILHGVGFNDFEIRQGNTLEDPQHLDKRFDIVVANPPFSQKWSADDSFLSDERFSSYGKLAPSSKADFAFIQHMIYQLADNGTMAVIVPHGVLFRGASEGVIRKYLLKDKNYIDAIIGLPANIFYGTSIPTCVIVVKKNRKADDDILFIDASNDFEKAKNQNYLRDEDVEKIGNTYVNREEIEKYSKKVSMKEIEENDYNLNIPRYVDTFEEEEEINLDEIVEKIGKIDEEMKEVDKTIKSFCDELGIKAPVV